MAEAPRPISYHYHVDGHEIIVTRRFVGEAYARNGNVGNPTKYFVWDAMVDGEIATTYETTRTVAYEYARAKAIGIPYYYPREGHTRGAINVRDFRIVAEEMKSNYRGKVKV